MTVETKPASGRWDDFASFMVPRKPGASGCVCIACSDGEIAGWCPVAPKSSFRALVNSRTIPHVDDAASAPT